MELLRIALIQKVAAKSSHSKGRTQAFVNLYQGDCLEPDRKKCASKEITILSPIYIYRDSLICNYNEQIHNSERHQPNDDKTHKAFSVGQAEG